MLAIKEFYTDSGNPYWLIFEKGNIGKPLFCLTEEQMREFKCNLLEQTTNLTYYNDIDFNRFSYVKS